MTPIRSRPPSIALALCALSTTPLLAQGGGGASTGPVIVYAQPGKKVNALKVMAADGSNQTTVVANLGSALPEAAWSADGSEIVFTSKLFGVWGLCAVRPDGSNLRLVLPVTWDLSAPIWSPAPAPDGRFKILFEDRAPGQTNTDLFLVNPDGSGLVNLTDTPDASESAPTWAPGAQRCAARVGHGSPWRTDILVYDLALVGGAITVSSTANVTDVAGSPLRTVSTVASPDWARTSDRIALSAPGAGGSFDLWIIDLAAPAAPFNVTSTSNVSEQNPSWSPDDSCLVFRRNATTNSSGLYRIDANGTGLASLNAPAGRVPDWRRP